MRDLRVHEAYRMDATSTHGWSGDETCGAFRMPSKIDGQDLIILASSGDGWEHVSVSRARRCPNWPEMEYVKRMFFKDSETVMQLHVPESEHINCHPNCLHLWRPTNETIPRPPGWMVGYQPKESDQCLP